MYVPHLLPIGNAARCGRGFSPDAMAPRSPLKADMRALHDAGVWRDAGAAGQAVAMAANRLEIVSAGA